MWFRRKEWPRDRGYDHNPQPRWHLLTSVEVTHEPLWHRTLTAACGYARQQDALNYDTDTLFREGVKTARIKCKKCMAKQADERNEHDARHDG